MQPQQNTNIHTAFIVSMNCLCVKMIYHTDIEIFVVFCSENLYILRIYPTFFITLLWIHGIYVCTCVCVCVCVCKYVQYNDLQECLYVDLLGTS